jgi:hypothetical protein
VLKVQHHGAIANIDEKFCRAVIADNYIFCGNGAHENPETEVIDAIVHSRIGTAAQRSKHAKTGDKFTLWFNSHETASNSDDDRAQMAKVKARVQTLKAQSNGQMDFKFITGSSFPPLPI